MNIIDLRSDTVTLPTEEMRKAISNAILGDDVSGEDPTVNKLEEKAADLMGKEASLLVSSGTQGNLIGILANCRSGDEIIVGENAHIFWNESAGAAALGGVQTHLVRNQPQGALNPSEVSSAIRPKNNPHFPPTSLICLENTQNMSNGGVLTVEDTKAIWDIASQNQIKVHLDGARIFNAAVYLDTPVKELVKYTDTLTFCLSKGLSAPVGSLLCGDRVFINRARRWRKMLGGGMRQAGIIAAAGIVALDSMIERLRDDHTTAIRISEGLSTIPGIIHDNSTVQTNILFFDIDPEFGTMSKLVGELEKRGVRVHSVYGRIRLVTHRHITQEEVNITLEAIANALKCLSS